MYYPPQELPTRHHPVPDLGVAEAAARVMQQARHVAIDDAGVARFCANYAAHAQPVPDWNRTLHYSEGSWRTANYVLVLDALNFCFWADPGRPRWTVTWAGQPQHGYWALAAALRRGLEGGLPLLDASWLAEVSQPAVACLLAGDDGVEIPLLEARWRHLREVGRVLRDRFDGRFANLIEAVGCDAVNVAATLAQDFQCFADEATYEGAPVPLLKRAQIVAVDLFGTFDGCDWGNLARLDAITAFADYKVPQVLRRLGVLRYDATLGDALDRLEEIPAGDAREVEIRAATVDAVQRIRRVLAAAGPAPRAFEIDWYLWGLGQTSSPDDRPYHRTRTVAY